MTEYKSLIDQVTEERKAFEDRLAEDIYTRVLNRQWDYQSKMGEEIIQKINGDYGISERDVAKYNGAWDMREQIYEIVEDLGFDLDRVMDNATKYREHGCEDEILGLEDIKLSRTG